jgi:murein endopeptidase
MPPVPDAAPTASDIGAPEAIDDGSGEMENDDAERADSNVEHAALPLPHPLDGWSAERIERAVRDDLASLGPISVGTPNAGALINGVQAQKSDKYAPMSPGAAWGTLETLTYLDAAIGAVQAQFPDTPALALGDIGVRRGGPLRPHISHQAGRDLDISFYYRDDAHWYARGTRDNLDLDRTWAFVRALITHTDVELILIDRAIQDWLREHALATGDDPVWLDRVFAGHGAMRPLIRHAKGHDTHIHVRFYNPIAQETARRAYASLLRHGLISRTPSYALHRAKRGETLGMIAKKYASSVHAIRDANQLHSNRIREQVVYRIPVAGGVPAAPARVRIPERMLPPSTAVHSNVSVGADPRLPNVSAQ